MMDNYGDGWNGAEWTLLSEGGVQKGVGTLETGVSGTETICRLGGCLDVKVSDGSYPTEISWEVLFNYDDSKLADGDSGGTSSSFCLTNPTTEPTTSPVPTTSPICPEGFDEVSFSDGSSKCYLIHTNYGIGGDWQGCQAYCTVKDASMLCIEDEYQQEALVSLGASMGGGGGVWIGYTKVESSWQWVDGCSSSHEEWYGGEPSYGYSGYIYAYANSAWSYEWWDAPESQSSHACGCETELQDQAPTTSPTLTSKPSMSPVPTIETTKEAELECEPGLEYYRGNCYRIGEDLIEKDSCSSLCDVLGESTLCIEDKGQQDYVIGMATDKVWLGYSISNNAWQWDTADCESSFESWDYGSPQNSYSNSYIDTDGTWANTRDWALCACQSKPITRAPTLSPTRECSVGTFYDGDGCSNCTVHMGSRFARRPFQTFSRPCACNSRLEPPSLMLTPCTLCVLSRRALSTT